MNQNNPYSITPEFWDQLAKIRSISRLVLVALAEDDIEEVERLSRESDRLMTAIRPVVEERARVKEGNEDDVLRKLLRELGVMNQRILEEIEVRRNEVREELGRVRDSKLRLVHYRNAHEPEPELLDIES